MRLRLSNRASSRWLPRSAFATVFLALICCVILSGVDGAPAAASTASGGGSATASTPAVSVSGSLMEGIGQRALRRGGEHLTFHLTGRSSFLSNLNAQTVRDAVSDATVVPDDGPHGWNAQKSVLFGSDARAEVSRNRKTVKVVLAPAPTYNTTTLERVVVSLPESLLAAPATMDSVEFVVLPSNRLAVHMQEAPMAGEPFHLRLDGAEAGVLNDTERTKFVLGTDCAQDAEGTLLNFDADSSTLTALLYRGAERYTLCYIPVEESSTNADSFVAADGVISIIGPRDFVVGGSESNVVSAETHIALEITGYKLTDEDTAALLRPGSAIATCAHMPIDTLDQVDVSLLTSSRGLVSLDTREAGDYHVCYLRSGANSFVQVPGHLSVVGDTMNHESVIVDGPKFLSNNIQARQLVITTGGVLHAESHHINVSTFRWEAGEVTGYGNVNIRNNGNISGGPKRVSFEIVNFGRLVIYLSQLTLSGSGRIINHGHLTLVVNATSAVIDEEVKSQSGTGWHTITNSRTGTMVVQGMRPGSQLHSAIPIMNFGVLEVEDVHVWVKRVSGFPDSRTRVLDEGQLIITDFIDMTGRLEAHETGIVALGGEIRLSRSRLMCSNGGSIAVTVSATEGNTILDTMSVDGSCRVFVQGLREKGKLQVQGYNAFGPNTTLGLSNVDVMAATVATVVSHGTVICNATSVTFGNQVMLSAYLRAIFFGEGTDGDAALLLPQMTPVNTSLTIPPNASLILLDVGSAAHRAGPHLCAQYIVIPIHVVLQGEVVLWGCATMPFGGKHRGVTRNASIDALASLTEYALCQMTVTGKAPSDQLAAIVPPDVCIPLFAQDQAPVSGLLLGGAHEIDPANRGQVAMSIDVLRVNSGRLSALSHVYLNLARELLVSDAAALSLVHGARVRTPSAEIAGLLEIDADYPTEFDGDVALRGPIDISLKLDMCAPAMRVNGDIVVHPGTEMSSTDIVEGSFGQSAAALEGYSIAGLPALSDGSFGGGATIRVVNGKAVIEFLDDAPPLSRRLPALVAAVAITLAVLILHVLRVGVGKFLREMRRVEDVPLHLTWPHFSAFTPNIVLVIVYVAEALLLGAVAFHPLLQHPVQLESIVSQYRFVFGLQVIGPNAATTAGFLSSLVLCWAVMWVPLLLTRVSAKMEHVLSQSEDNAMYTVQLLHQFHTFAAWTSLVCFFPIVSMLLDAPMCATVLNGKDGCERLRGVAPLSAIALIVFVILTPYSGTAGRFAYCHPTYSHTVDLRQKRASTFVLCFILTVMAAAWKINGHDLTASTIIGGVGSLALFVLHWRSQPCAYSNVNLFRRLLLSWPMVTVIASFIQILRGATTQVCAPVDHLYVVMLIIGMILCISGTIFVLRRCGKRANDFEALVHPGVHQELSALRALWTEIEAERMRLYNTPDHRARSAINVRIQEYRLNYMKQLVKYRNEQERDLAEYYLGYARHFTPESPSASLDHVPMQEAAKKEVTNDDIDQLTPAQMASFAEGPVLGRGTFGVVHMAMLPKGKLVAVKVVTVQKKHKNESIAAVRREVEMLRDLRHPNIIQFHGIHTNKREIFIFMELATNGSLTQIARKFGQIPEHNIRTFTRQTLEGLKYLHERGIVHRDVKGENILIDGDGTAKLGDFGCSKALAEAAHHSQQGCASLVGSPYWMAPEVIRSEAYGTKADVWSLGCTVVEMLNGGRPPWLETFDNVYSAMFFIGNSTGLPTNIPAGLSEDCEGFLQRCFDRDPSSRASVTELLRHDWIAGDHVPSEGTPTEGDEPPMRRGWSELFESDSEGPASRTGSLQARHVTDSLFGGESIPLRTVPGPAAAGEPTTRERQSSSSGDFAATGTSV